MSTEPIDGEHNADILPLRARPPRSPKVGGIVARRLRRRHRARRAEADPARVARQRRGAGGSTPAGRLHVALARFHGLRSPVYLAGVRLRTARRRGAGRQVAAVVAVPGPGRGVGRRDRRRAPALAPDAAVHAEMTISAQRSAWPPRRGAVLGVLMWSPGAVGAVLLAPAAVVVLPGSAEPEGVRIVKPAKVPQAYEVLTEDVIARALGSLGSPGSTRGYARATGSTSPARSARTGQGGGRDQPALWRDGHADHRPAGRVRLRASPAARRGVARTGHRRARRAPGGVGRAQDVSKAKAPPWPLLRSGAVDIFQPFPFAFDVRGRKVLAPLIYTNWLIGSIPRQGKTGRSARWSAASPWTRSPSSGSTS